MRPAILLEKRAFGLALAEAHDTGAAARPLSTSSLQTSTCGAMVQLLSRLLASLVRMVRAGHRPSDGLMIRLGDGRVKLYTGPNVAGMSHEWLRRLSNEYGALRLAVRVTVEEHNGAALLMVEVLQPWRGRVEQRCHRLADGSFLEGPIVRSRANETDQCPGLSKNAAIFARSLGITTGLLPNADVSNWPDGVFSSPVW